jgi:HK97 family phage portal protein
MNIFDSIKRVLRSFHPRDPAYWTRKWWGGTESKSGVAVDEETAMKYSAYSSGVRLIAETIAAMPLNIYENLEERGKRKASKHPLHSLLHDQPNEDMDSFTWRETAKGHILGWGNHYSLLKRNPRTRYIEEVYPLEPWRIKPEMIKTPSFGRIKVYRYQPEEGPEITIEKDDILHIHGLSYNGLVGVSPLTWYREQIGLGLAMEEYSSRFFSNGTHAGGVFTTPQALKPDTYERLKKELKENYAGLGKSHSTMMLEQDLKFDKISINPNDAQLLESKKFQIEEIARALRIPLPFLQVSEPISDNNIEHLGIHLVVFCLLPWIKRDEQAYNMQLFTEGDKGKYFSKYIVEGLLRGDSTARSEYYVKMIQNGVYSQNDVLEMEDRNPYEGGNKHWIQLNMQSIEDVGKLIDGSREIIINGQEIRIAQKEIKSIEDRAKIDDKLAEKLAKAYKPLFFNAIARIIKREKVDINKILRDFGSQTEPEKINNELENYYKKHSVFAESQIKPSVYAFSEVLFEQVFSEDNKKLDIDIFSASYSDDFTKRYIESNLAELTSIPGEDKLSQIKLKLDQWEEDKPEQLSSDEIKRILKVFKKYIEKIK